MLWEKLHPSFFHQKTKQQIPLQNTIRNPPHTQCDIPTHASTEFTLCANLTDVKGEQHIFEYLECLLNQKSENYVELLPKVFLFASFSLLHI